MPLWGVFKREMGAYRFELKTLLMHYKDRVEFIQGTPVKDSDLDRVSAKVASAVYLFADSQAKVQKLFVLWSHI